MIRVCPSCGVKNRVPAARLADTGRCGACKQALPAAAEPIEADTALFTEITREISVPVLVDFWAPWCEPCTLAAPEVARAAANLAGRAVVLKINVDDNPVLSNQLGIRSIPTFALFKNGMLRWQQPGLLTHRQMEQLVLEMDAN
jgi:thioredoxin 2